MTPVDKFNSLQAKKIMKELNKRNMEAFYCASKEDALKKVLELIPEESSVSWGGSQTLAEAGIIDAINNGNYRAMDRSIIPDEELDDFYANVFKCDYYLLSSNAVTLDGKLVNIDGRGNRMAAFIFGPKNVIVVVSMNKVATDEETALKRVRNVAAPTNTLRLSVDTPCTKTGICSDCNTPQCICSQIVITRNSSIKNRIKVILVGEKLGF